MNKLIASLDRREFINDKRFNGETYVFGSGESEMNLEQVVGMILKHIKKLASGQANSEIRDIVLTVPSSWGYSAKMCLVNAAHIAGFSVLGLINENSAAAIQLAISRNDSEATNLMLFNYGSYNLQISVISVFGEFNE
jgi:hypoxia up-regulated 1